MTTLTVVEKDGMAAIAADTMSTQGSCKLPAKFKRGGSKIIPVNGSYIASAGTSTNMLVLRSLVRNRAQEFDLSSADSIFETFRKFHKVLVDEYYVKTDADDDDQEYESNQLNILIADETGIYEQMSYREVNQYERFWATGSGFRFALGAMEASYDDPSLSAKEIAERGVQIGCLFDEGSGLPLESYEIKLNSS